MANKNKQQMPELKAVLQNIATKVPPAPEVTKPEPQQTPDPTPDESTPHICASCGEEMNSLDALTGHTCAPVATVVTTEVVTEVTTELPPEAPPEVPPAPETETALVEHLPLLSPPSRPVYLADVGDAPPAPEAKQVASQSTVASEAPFIPWEDKVKLVKIDSVTLQAELPLPGVPLQTELPLPAPIQEQPTQEPVLPPEAPSRGFTQPTRPAMPKVAHWREITEEDLKAEEEALAHGNGLLAGSREMYESRGVDVAAKLREAKEAAAAEVEETKAALKEKMGPYIHEATIEKILNMNPLQIMSTIQFVASLHGGVDGLGETVVQKPAAQFKYPPIVKGEPLSEEEKQHLQMVLRKMSDASKMFYSFAVSAGNHAFIEFTGVINEYINICREALAKGIDFTEANIHAGIPLPLEKHNIAYMAEKLGCIFAPAFLYNPELTEEFKANFFKKLVG